MRILRAWFLRLGSLFVKRRHEQEMADEFESHLQMHIVDNVRTGMTPEEARRQALIKLGGLDQVKENYRDRRRLPMLETLLQDLRYGLRSLVKDPGFTAVAVLTLALGIGANSAIFSLINAVLLRPLPYPRSGEIVAVFENYRPSGHSRNMVAPRNFLAWESQSDVFSMLAAYGWDTLNLTSHGEPRELTAARVSASFFPLFGMQPVLGRALSAADQEQGKQHVVVLSERTWRSIFNADPNIVGRPLTLNDTPYTVAGIMPAAFERPGWAEAWVPIAFNEKDRQFAGRYLRTFGRLKPGVSQRQAQTEMDVIANRLEIQFPEANTGFGVNVVDLNELLVGDVRPALMVFWGAVGLVLLIACANVSNLLLARVNAKRRDTAIRVALGATRRRLVLQALIQYLLLWLIGAAVGLLLAVWGLETLVAARPQNLPNLEKAKIDGFVLAFTCLVSVLSCLIFGLLPAFQQTKTNAADALKAAGNGAKDRAFRWTARDLIVIGEVALTFMLLASAGLLTDSFLRLSRINPGFNPDNLLTLRIDLPVTRYPAAAKQASFYNRAIAQIESLPGVVSVACTSFLPLSGFGAATDFVPLDRPAPPVGHNPVADVRFVTPHYFAALGMPLLSGRTFTEADEQHAIKPLVITEATARQLWPQGDAIGKEISMEWEGNLKAEIVGIVGDAKLTSLDGDIRPTLYWPNTSTDNPSLILMVRSARDPAMLANAVRAEIHGIDADLPVVDIQTMDQVLSGSVSQNRFNMSLVVVFAVGALILSAIGVYGLHSYNVAQRTREMSIRMALGANANDVLWLVLGRGSVLALAGVSVGLIGAFASAHLLSSLLYGVRSTDPAIYTVVAVILTSAAILAGYVPARRATKVDPMVALRYE